MGGALCGHAQVPAHLPSWCPTPWANTDPCPPAHHHRALPEQRGKGPVQVSLLLSFQYRALTGVAKAWVITSCLLTPASYSAFLSLTSPPWPLPQPWYCLQECSGPLTSALTHRRPP